MEVFKVSSQRWLLWLLLVGLSYVVLIPMLLDDAGLLPAYISDYALYFFILWTVIVLAGTLRLA